MRTSHSFGYTILSVIFVFSLTLSNGIGAAQAIGQTTGFSAEAVFAEVNCSDYATYPWMDPSKTPEERAQLLLAASTLDQKLRWLDEQAANNPTQTSFGRSPNFVTYPAQVPCTPTIQYTDGPAAVSGATGKVTAFPSQMALAATWDVTISREKGKAQGYEAFHQHRNVVLGPGMASGRVPMLGRTSEYLGEDSLLSGRIAAAVVKGIQLDNPNEPVEAVIKHYLGNEQELDRNNTSSNIDERALHQVYALPFEVAVKEGDPGGIMCSFNQVNGIWACENSDIQVDILKEDIGFKGWIVTDFGSQHSTAASLNAGLDQELNRPVYYTPDALKAALEAGQITTAQIDEAAYRIVRAHFASRLFDVALPAAAEADSSTAENQAVGLKVAEQGAVLLKNTAGILPIAGDGLTVAVIGATASNTPTGGISAASVCGATMPSTPCTPIAPLDAITTRVTAAGGTVIYDAGSDLTSAATAATGADIAIVFGYYREGESSDLPNLSLSPQTNATLFAGVDAGATNLTTANFGSLVVGSTLFIGAGSDQQKVTVTALGRPATDTVLGFAAAAGDTNVKLPSVGGLAAGDSLTIDTGSNLETVTVATVGTAGATTVRTATAAGATSIPVASIAGFKAGDVITIDSGGNQETTTVSSVSSGWSGSSITVPALTNAHAVGVQVSGSGVTFTPALTKDHASGAVVKSVGTGITFTPALTKAHAGGTALFSSHGDDLIGAVAAANTQTVVVLQTGGPVLMPWIDEVEGVLETWYAGQSMGTAIVNLLWGDVNPSGRLPMTFPKLASDLPTAGSTGQYPGLVSGSVTRPAGDTTPRQVDYTESLQVGYRWYDAQNIEPLFPFGFGLSYGATFEYAGLTVQPRDRGFDVTFSVKNTGTAAATEVPQLYLGLPSGLGEPPKRLAGWSRITLAPGETRTVTIAIDEDSADHPLSYWDVDADQWVTPYGKAYIVHVGSSAGDIHLTRSTSVYMQLYMPVISR